MTLKTLYLIHFEDKISGHAQHYLGITKDLDMRLNRHGTGCGAKLMAEVTRLGIGWRVVRTWRGRYQHERWLKKHKRHSIFCPVCSPKTWKKQGRLYSKKNQAAIARA